MDYIPAEVRTCNTISEQIYESFNIGIIALIVFAAALIVGILMTAFGGAGFDGKTLLASISLVTLSAIMFIIGVIVYGIISGSIC